jgi:hypothetical protein
MIHATKIFQEKEREGGGELASVKQKLGTIL